MLPQWLIYRGFAIEKGRGPNNRFQLRIIDPEGNRRGSAPDLRTAKIDIDEMVQKDILVGLRNE